MTESEINEIIIEKSTAAAQSLMEAWEITGVLDGIEMEITNKKNGETFVLKFTKVKKP
jgi:hypothetical protein